MTKDNGYWITPPYFYETLNRQYHFDFDPCPYPRGDFDGLSVSWGMMNYVNPPYLKVNGGTSKWVKKAIYERDENYCSSILVIPIGYSLGYAMNAGARWLGMTRIKWLHIETGIAQPNPGPVAIILL